MPRVHAATSAVGRLRTVLLHRPGPEITRGCPLGDASRDPAGHVDQVRREHDVVAEILRDHGVAVLYLTDLLRDVLTHHPARRQAIAAVVEHAGLGDELAGQVHRHLDGLDPDALSHTLVTGVTRGEFPTGRGAVYQLLDDRDFLLAPLPDLLFTRDLSVWFDGGAAIASPTTPARRAQARLLQVVYEHHPGFAGTAPLYRPDFEPLAAGDVLVLAAGVVAVGVGRQTVPAAAERLARRIFTTGLARVVLAVRLHPHWSGTLGAACAMVDVDAMMIPPALAYTLTARTITADADRLRVVPPEPFLAAAAREMGLDRLRVIDVDVDTRPGGRRGPDAAGAPLTIAPRLAVCYESSADTAAALEASGVEVIRVPGGAVLGGLGGPRRLCCPVNREPG